MSAGSIRAGQAFIEVFLDKSRLTADLRGAGNQLKSFGNQIGAVGAAGTAVLGAALVSVSDRAAQVRNSFQGLDQTSLDALLKGTDLLTAKYGVELPRQLEAVRTVMSNFEVDSKTALDILAAGFASGLNKSDDLLDTLQEYSSEFAELGLSADDSLGILSRGLEAGARNTDVVADGIKEFGILVREADTAKKIAEISPAMAGVVQQFQRGEITGKQALGTLTESLFSLESTTDRAGAGILLFGTKYEDMGEQAVRALGNINGETINTAGALDDAGSKVGSLSEVFKRLWNTIEQGMAPVNLRLIEFFEEHGDKFTTFTETIAPLVPALAAISAALVTVGGAAILLGNIISSIGTLVTVASKVPAALAFLGPAGLVALGALAVVALSSSFDTLGQSLQTPQEQFESLNKLIEDNISLMEEQGKVARAGGKETTEAHMERVRQQQDALFSQLTGMQQDLRERTEEGEDFWGGLGETLTGGQLDTAADLEIQHLENQIKLIEKQIKANEEELQRGEDALQADESKEDGEGEDDKGMTFAEEMAAGADERAREKEKQQKATAQANAAADKIEARELAERDQQRRQRERDILVSSSSALNTAGVLGTQGAADAIARALGGAAGDWEKKIYDESRKQTKLLKGMQGATRIEVG